MALQEKVMEAARIAGFTPEEAAAVVADLNMGKKEALVYFTNFASSAISLARARQTTNLIGTFDDTIAKPGNDVGAYQNALSSVSQRNARGRITEELASEGL